MRGAELYGAGYDLTHPDTSLYQDYFYVEGGLNDHTLNSLEEIVQEQQIQFIFLAHDQYLYDFRECFEIFGARIIHNNTKAIEITSFKSKTYEFFRGKIPIPNTFTLDEALQLEKDFFVKPDRGQGSRGVFTASKSDLEVNYSPTCIISENLPGVEYTIDCFSSRNSTVVYAAARERVQTLQGISVKTKILSLPVVSKYSEIISHALKLNGAWFFQMKEDSSGELKLLEIGLRVAGASGINRLRGINLPQMQIHQELGQEIAVLAHPTKPEVSPAGVDLGFDFQEVFLDFDDTMVFGETVRPGVMSFLSNCELNDIPVSVVSRHAGNLEQVLLNKFPNFVFSEIIHIVDKSNKSKYLPQSKKILFVDDSFSERKEVTESLKQGVLALDPSVFQFLDS
jgi:hypothetical protein